MSNQKQDAVNIRTSGGGLFSGWFGDFSGSAEVVDASTGEVLGRGHGHGSSQACADSRAIERAAAEAVRQSPPPKR